MSDREVESARVSLYAAPQMSARKDNNRMSSIDPRIPPKQVGFARIVAATRYSIEGLRACYQSEEAFRIESVIALILTPVAFFVGETRVEIVLLLLAMVLVLLVELLNSAIESVVDRTGSEFHILSKKAKDIGSAAVFISLLFFLLIWGLILLPN